MSIDIQLFTTHIKSNSCRIEHVYQSDKFINIREGHAHPEPTLAKGKIVMGFNISLETIAFTFFYPHLGIPIKP